MSLPKISSQRLLAGGKWIRTVDPAPGAIKGESRLDQCRVGSANLKPIRITIEVKDGGTSRGSAQRQLTKPRRARARRPVLQAIRDAGTNIVCAEGRSMHGQSR